MDKNLIIVINEDFALLSQLGEIIKKFDFTPVLFHTFDEAYKFLEKNEPYLVISDLFFKNSNPAEIWSILREYLKLENILIVSSEADNELGSKVIREGAVDYLLAPVENEQIKLILAKIKLQQRKTIKAFREFITNNEKMKIILKIVESAAKSRSTVLIRGESGVGKELIARMLHDKSERAGNPFVAINCAALPETLLESELFGHEKGSFTGAITTKLGKFELAHNGSILLDEITEMDFMLQAKLLRVLQEREIDRIGGREPIKVDVRVIATTNRDMRKVIEEKKFREDLYYRLNVIPIIIPPLRERKGDIPLLADYFIKKHCQLNKIMEKSIDKSAIKKLTDYHWPGNVRELENIIERAVIICPDKVISKDFILFEEEFEKMFEKDFLNKPYEKTIDNMAIDSSLNIKPGMSIAEMEKKLILETLKHVNANRTLAAELLGISVRTLRNKINEYKKMGIKV